MKLRDTLWIWGQDAGSHHAVENNMWKLPGVNKMGPAEGCAYLGIPNCCRVVSGGKPAPPFDHEADRLDGLRSVVWSAIGDSSSLRNNEETDLEEVIRIAALHPNTLGAVMDDFMNEKRMAIFTPEKIADMGRRLRAAIPGRPLELWTVLYFNEVSEKIVPYLPHLDRITFWAWEAEQLRGMEEAYASLRALAGDRELSILAGCYFYDYGTSSAMPMDLMEYQLETYGKWLREGAIDGIVFCSNAIADIGLETVPYAREWIRAHAEDEVPETGF